jgi:hypothetical protein
MTVLPGSFPKSAWSEGSKNYIRNVEAVGSNPITSTKKVQFNGLKVEPGRPQIPRERRHRSLPVFRADVKFRFMLYTVAPVPA